MHKKEPYIEKILTTENKDYAGIIARFSTPGMQKLAHGICGIADESGELMGAFKAFIFYGKELDKTNLLEELGDLLYFTGLAIDALGSDFETVQRMNIKKLEARYGGSWSEDKAINRDRDKEREAMEEAETSPGTKTF